MASEDKFSDRITDLDSPADDFAAITPGDNVDLAQRTRGILVGAAGNVVLVRGRQAPVLRYGPGERDIIRYGSGESDTIKHSAESTVTVAVQAGQVLPIRTRRVNSTGTTPGLGLVALY